MIVRAGASILLEGAMIGLLGATVKDATTGNTVGAEIASVTQGGAADKAGLKAEKHVAKELDVSAKEVDQAVQDAARDVS